MKDTMVKLKWLCQVERGYEDDEGEEEHGWWDGK
jgi:hypothetical protein